MLHYLHYNIVGQIRIWFVTTVVDQDMSLYRKLIHLPLWVTDVVSQVTLNQILNEREAREFDHSTMV